MAHRSADGLDSIALGLLRPASQTRRLDRALLVRPLALDLAAAGMLLSLPTDRKVLGTSARVHVRRQV